MRQCLVSDISAKWNLIPFAQRDPLIKSAFFLVIPSKYQETDRQRDNQWDNIESIFFQLCNLIMGSNSSNSFFIWS